MNWRSAVRYFFPWIDCGHGEELTYLAIKIQETQDELRRLREDGDRSSQMFAAYRRENDELRSRIDGLHAQIREATERAERYAKSNDDLRDSNDRLRNWQKLEIAHADGRAEQALSQAGAIRIEALRAKDTLKFYADESNYAHGDGEIGGAPITYASRVQTDGGAMARAALEDFQE